MEYTIKKLEKNNKKEIEEIIRKEWGSDLLIIKGKKYYLDNLDGYIAVADKKIIGVITYLIKNKKCEIVTINSFRENMGIGTSLINAVKLKARDNKCAKIWLVTTNDNIGALKFYQRYGFDITKINRNSIKKSRKIKPELPLLGLYDIPIMHEIEFEFKL